MENNVERPIVIDLGSGTVKCGFSGLRIPEHCFRSVVGRPRNPGIFVGIDIPNVAIGEDAFRKRGLYRLKYPVEHGMVCNWNDLEQILQYAFNRKMEVNTENHPVFITEAPLCPKSNREKMMSILFETFNVPKFFSSDHSILTCFSYGLTTGCVVESGDGVSHTCPIFEGYHSKKKNPGKWDYGGHAILRMNVAGRDITDYLVKILSERGYEMTTSAEREIVKDMKEKLCYYPLDFYKTQEKAYEDETEYLKEYELPDGTFMKISHELFRAPQIMFCPSFLGSSMCGIHETLYNSIQKCEKEQRNSMFENILFGGGNTMFEGMEERLESLITDLAPRNAKVKVHGREDRKFSSWIGASIISELSSFQKNCWVTSEEYDEFGPNLVHKKCSPFKGGLSEITESMLILRKKDVDMDERVEYILNKCILEKTVENVVTTKIILGNEKIIHSLSCIL